MNADGMRLMKQSGLSLVACAGPPTGDPNSSACILLRLRKNLLAEISTNPRVSPRRRPCLRGGRLPTLRFSPMDHAAPARPDFGAPPTAIMLWRPTRRRSLLVICGLARISRLTTSRFYPMSNAG
jgi:hypothetical protein